MSFSVTAPYAPRPIRFEGVTELNGHRIKRYYIRHPDLAPDRAAFAGGLALAEAALPDAAIDAGRPGAGFLIEHQGRGVNYVILGRWARENELPLQVFTDRGTGWTAARGDESFCVWDLEVIGAERDLYVRHVLTPAPNLDAYLAAGLTR